MVWLDFGIGTSSRIDAFLESLWPQIKDGGYLLMHSTLTNKVTRTWLEKFRSDRRRDTKCGNLEDNTYRDTDQKKWMRNVDVDLLSFLEPHKRFQNSVSIFQKRGEAGNAYVEPIYTTFP